MSEQKPIPPGLTRAGKGRPIGAQNKTTRLAKEAITLAFEGLGGVEGLIDWAKESPENKAIFYERIFTKLLPVQVNADMRSLVVADVIYKGLNG